jgi:hypothetical protein
VQRSLLGVESAELTMTGHIPDSHKKRTPTRHIYNNTTPSSKKHRLSSSVDDIVGAPVTQSQSHNNSPKNSQNTTVSNGSSDASVTGLETVVNRLSVSPSQPIGLPLADDAAVAEMATGGPLRSLNFGKTNLLQKQKRNTKKFVPFKLDNNSVYPFLCKKIVDCLKEDLKNKKFTPSNPTSVLRTSRSFFETISYSKKPKVAPGQSSRIANLWIIKANDSQTIVLDLNNLDFDIDKVSQVASNFDYHSMNCNFSLDSRKL